MTGLLRELVTSARALLKAPGFSALAVLMFGLGIAANSTVFGWIYTVLLRPVPGVERPEELAVLEAVSPEGRPMGSLTHPDFRDFQRQMTTISGATASHLAFFNVGPPEAPRRVLGQLVSANYFAVLGVRPHLGRLFRVEEDRDARGAYPYIVVSHRLWRDYFRADPGLAGKAVRVSGRVYTVAGVTPPGFQGNYGGVALDLWTPLSQAVETGNLNTWAASDRNARFLEVTVRRKPGMAVETVREEARLVAARIAEAYPDSHRKVSATVFPLSQASYGMQATLGNPLRYLAVVCGLVLLIACANVANLLMARSVSRQREFGIRAALGASRGRLVRQLLVEVLLLTAGGAAMGAILAQWLTEGIVLVLPAFNAPVRAALSPLLASAPAAPSLLFTIATAFAAALISTLAPAAYAAHIGPGEAMHDGGRGGSTGIRGRRARGVLAAGEVALATLAVAGAGLTLRGFHKLTHVPVGFNVDHVLVAQLHLSTNGFTLDREKRFSRDLKLRLERAPGVDSVGSANAVPLSIFGGLSDRVQQFGTEADRLGVIRVPCNIVGPGYFQTLGIPLLAGRELDERDQLNPKRREAAIVVNQTFARKYLNTADPVGRTLRVSGGPARVVGMVRDSKNVRHGEGPTPYFYGAFGQMFWSGHNHFVLIRARDEAAAREALRREAMALGVTPGMYEVATLKEFTEAGVFGERVAAGLLSVLAALALALACAGLYGVLAYLVTERTREIGIRMALGAGRWRVLGAVLGRGMALTAAGLLLGGAAAAAGVRMFGGLFASVAAEAEPAVLAGAALTLGLAAAAASLIPAWRATRVNPITALRAE